MDPHRLVLLCLFFVGFLEVFATSAKIAKNGKNKPREVHEWLVHDYSVTSHGYHPCVHVFCWCSHGLGTLPEILLETMGGNTTQPRLDDRISQPVSALPLKLVFKSKSPNTCLVHPCAAISLSNNLAFLACIKSHHSLHKVASFCTVPLHKGVQHCLKWIQSHFQRGSCAAQSSFNLKM